MLVVALGLAALTIGATLGFALFLITAPREEESWPQ
jgi:hypothetical protein